jgi:hypothetical protein
MQLEERTQSRTQLSRNHYPSPSCCLKFCSDVGACFLGASSMLHPPCSILIPFSVCKIAESRKLCHRLSSIQPPVTMVVKAGRHHHGARDKEIPKPPWQGSLGSPFPGMPDIRLSRDAGTGEGLIIKRSLIFFAVRADRYGGAASKHYFAQ